MTTMTVDPEPTQLREVLARTPQGVPVVMVNLLRFRERANYPVDHEQATGSLSGRQAYGLYSEGAIRHVHATGGEVIYLGRAAGSLIGPAGEHWDEVILVRYPSIAAFMGMITQPAYQGLAVHRTAALEDARLIVTSE